MSNSRELPLLVELSAAADHDQYLIRSEIEILFVLRALMQSNTLVALYFNQGNDFILTSILDLDAERGEMVIDYGAREELNRQVLAAEKLIFIASQDQVKVQFVCHRIEEIQFEGRSAFRVGTPDSLLRVQRREYFRIATPAINPLKCTIPLPAGRGAAELTLLDISCGGIALIDYHPRFDFTPGADYENCRIVLPGIGTLNVTIRVKITFESTRNNGLPCKHYGCEFVGMPENKLAMTQRYIMKLERERKAKQVRMR